MNRIKTFLTRTVIFALLIAAGAAIIPAQQSPAPREEKLLNGLKVVVWSDARTSKVTVRTRIHSGASFDPLGKEGVMKLLSEIIFPNDSAREFFTDDLGGSLEIICNYDYIQINASGDADKLLTILETISAALTMPQINKETTERVKAPHLKRVAEMETRPAYLADMAAANRLLGNYPYGRPMLGSSDSLQKIDFADILFAKQRFLTSDNATVTISGNVKADFALRAARRLFGGWLKADKLIPSTFAQPATPDPTRELIRTTADPVSEIRFATRGVARDDRDFFAAKIVESVIRSRVTKREGPKAFARQSGNTLPGIFMIGMSDWNTATVRVVDDRIALPVALDEYPAELLKASVSASEFESAKSELIAEMSGRDPADMWLDVQTYKLPPVKDQMNSLLSTSGADAERVLDKIRKQTFVSVLYVTTVKSPAAQ